MDGILVINKPSGITSRDVVNKISKLLNTKKVGHTGTLDPLATGVLVLCIGKATKLVDVITGTDKEYIASVKLGISTDTLDVEGKVLEKRNCYVNKQELIRVLKSFIGKYNQEVPIYSAVKINGKKLYEYARRNEKVNLPKREVEIKKIELLEFSNDSYSFKVTVSKGTYIRSLIKDINDKLGVIGVMDSLKRTRQGMFKIDNSYTLEDVLNNKHKLISIKDALQDKKCVTIDDNLFDVIKHGGIINNIYKEDYVTFIHNGNVVSIYKIYDKDKTKMKPYKMFI